MFITYKLVASGLCEVCPSSDKPLMVFPAHKTGSLQVVDLSQLEPAASMSPVTIKAHQGELACLAINQQGTMVATASAKVGLLICSTMCSLSYALYRVRLNLLIIVFKTI